MHSMRGRAACTMKGRNTVDQNRVRSYLAALTRPKEFTMTMPTNQELCQQVADVHFAISTNWDYTIAQSDSPVYANSQRLFLATIRVTYNLSALKARRVYAAWLDSYESIEYCVRFIADNPRSFAYMK